MNVSGLITLSQPPVICVVSGMGIHLHEDSAGKVPSLRLLAFMVTWGDNGVTHGVTMGWSWLHISEYWTKMKLSTSWIAVKSVNMSNSSSVDWWKTLRVQSIRFSFFWVNMTWNFQLWKLPLKSWNRAHSCLAALDIPTTANLQTPRHCFRNNPKCTSVRRNLWPTLGSIAANYNGPIGHKLPGWCRNRFTGSLSRVEND